MDTTAPAATPVTTRRRHDILRRWPTALGLTAAVVALATGPERDSVAITVSVATLCYLGAAALGRPWVAWAGIIGGSLVVTASTLIGLEWWVGVGIAALILIGTGLLRRVSIPILTAQTVAMVAFGSVAVAALFFAPSVGLALAGVALASHAAWDVIHYWRNQVVPRSLAEFCMLLDVPVGLGAIVLAIAG